MGQLMSHPVQEKTLDYHPRQSLSYAIGLMQGYRMSMEDAHSVKVNADESVAVFGVYDGHGGRQSADFVSERLTALIFAKLREAAQPHLHTTAPPPLGDLISLTRDAFFKIDHDLHAQAATHCGTTAIVATVFNHRYIMAANTGDLRCILLLKGGLAKTLLFDHKPCNMGERVRIENSGGYVINSRVNEILALLRAFGDFKFKIPYVEPLRDYYYSATNRPFFTNGLVHIPPELMQVTVEPEFLVYDMQALDTPEFIVLACDGIWDCYTNRQLVRVIRDKLALGWLLTHITELVLNNCIEMASNVTGIGFDNMTMIIVALHPGGDTNEWYGMMKARILKEKGVEG